MGFRNAQPTRLLWLLPGSHRRFRTWRSGWPVDFGTTKAIENLDYLRSVATGVNRRLLELCVFDHVQPGARAFDSIVLSLLWVGSETGDQSLDWPTAR